MAGEKRVLSADLSPGDRLAEDVMVGNQVLMRAGTILTQTNIDRISRLQLIEVQISGPEEAAPSVVKVQSATGSDFPDFSTIIDSTLSGWMSDEHFNSKVEPGTPKGPVEQSFEENKDRLRRESGLTPMLAAAVDRELKKDIHASYMTSVLNQKIDLEQLAAQADKILDNLGPAEATYIECVDSDHYGEHLANRALMACKLMNGRFGDNGLDVREHFRGHLALANVVAMLPNGTLDHSSLENETQRQKATESLLAYYSWLRSQKFISENTLESILLQHERFDGSGIPYGLSGEEIPAISEAWAMSNTYSSRLFSKPAKPRSTGRQAADHLVGSAGKAFSSRSVNRFLSDTGYYPNGSLVELNDTRQAIVVSQNSQAMLKPNVRLIDENEQVSALVELSKEKDLYIQRQVLEY